MLKWGCPTTEQWEKYLLASEAPEQGDLKHHLEVCPHCRFVLSQLVLELDSLKASWQESLSQDVIVLSPLRSEVSTNGSVSMRLAAQGTQGSTAEVAITLASEDRRVLLRFVKDVHTEETWLYVVAEDPVLYENVLVRLPLRNREFITDSQGRANLGSVDWPEKDLLNAEIRPPQATFILSPLETEGGKSIELQSSKGDHIRVAFADEGRNLRFDIQILRLSEEHDEVMLKAAIRVADSDKLVQIQPVLVDHASFVNVGPAQKLEVYLYR